MGMDRITLERVPQEPRMSVVGLARRERVRELAKFLGLDAGSVAEGLVEAVEHDPSLRRSPLLHHAA
jgi:hypothetical protein